MRNMGKGIHKALAAPAGSPKSVRDLIKVPCRSIPGFMIAYILELE
jgi:hypothetical protein